MKRLLLLLITACLIWLPMTAWAHEHHGDREYRHYTIRVSANEGGHVSPDGYVRVREGGSVTIHIRPHHGYAVKRVIVDGEDVGRRPSYHFSHIHRSHRVKVVFGRAHHHQGGYGDHEHGLDHHPN